MDHMKHMTHMDHMKHMGHDNHASHLLNKTEMDMSSTTMNMDDMGGMDMDMKMYFHFGYTDNEAVLFDWWRINTIWELLLSMLGIFVLAFLYEGLKYAREYLFRRALHSSEYTSTSKNNITITDGQQPVRYYEQIIMPPSMNMLSKEHFIQTMLHMLQFLLSYFLMLIFMTYNAWLCLACLFGAGTGYFFFGWRKSVVVDITEHCH